jgi:hypothetical protein
MDHADDIGNVTYLCEHGPQDCHSDQQKTPIAQMTKTSKGFLVEPLTAEFEPS